MTIIVAVISYFSIVTTNPLRECSITKDLFFFSHITLCIQGTLEVGPVYTATYAKHVENLTRIFVSEFEIIPSQISAHKRTIPE